MHKKRCVCFVQLHYTDLEHSAHAENNPIKKIADAHIVDEIVLAAADIPENESVVQFARENNTAVHLGAVDNIANRMVEVAEKYSADFLVRILINWFFCDVELIKNMIAYAHEVQDFDYMNLPYDFDIKFGCDLHTIQGLKKLAAYLESEEGLNEQYKFRPWSLLESDSFFTTVTFNDVPVYSNVYFYQLRDALVKKAPDAWNFGAFFYYHEYEHAKKYIDTDDVVLDISCGFGNGTAIIAKGCKKIYGFDINEEYISYARERHSHEPTIEFILGDEKGINLSSDSIDKIISVHTMEHVKDDDFFLKEIKRVLMPDGCLIIEVPLRMRRPFLYNNEPLVPCTDTYPGHCREYTVDIFRALVSKYFHVLEVAGVSRGSYVPVDKSRNAVSAILQKRAQ